MLYYESPMLYDVYNYIILYMPYLFIYYIHTIYTIYMIYASIYMLYICIKTNYASD